MRKALCHRPSQKSKLLSKSSVAQRDLWLHHLLCSNKFPLYLMSFLDKWLRLHLMFTQGINQSHLMNMKFYQPAHQEVLYTTTFQFLVLHTCQMLDPQTIPDLPPKNTCQMLDPQTIPDLPPKNTNLTIPSIVNRFQKKFDKSGHVRNVAAKIVLEKVPESTAKILVRIVGMWTVLGAIAKILKSPVKMDLKNLSCTISCKYDYCGFKQGKHTFFFPYYFSEFLNIFIHAW